VRKPIYMSVTASFFLKLTFSIHLNNMFQMDALDSMPDVSCDLIPEHITALLFICHIPNFTHLIKQMSPDWYNGFVQLQSGGNFVCLCECKKQKIRLAHILGTQNIFGFKMVASK
jgi:hypothetical protein